MLPGLFAGACMGLLVASCAANSAKQSSRAPQTMGAEPAGAPSPEHDEIARLDKAIDDELAQRNLPPQVTPACASAGCADASATAVSMGVHPRIEGDPATQTCKPAASDTCKDSCTLSDSICGNAEKICTLAKQLGANDSYANEKCAKGTTTCKKSQERCCSCM